MKLFHAPGSCSLGIRIILEEINAPHGLEILDLKSAGQRSPAFLALNPKGKVPVLVRDDGSILTEFPAIAVWLARSFPKADLLAEGLEAEVRALELMDFVVAGLHMRAATLAMVPQKFVQNPQAQAELRAYGTKTLHDGLLQLADRLGTQEYFLGQYSIADAAVFYLLNWRDRFDFALPERLAGFHARMRARPAVQRALGH